MSEIHSEGSQPEIMECGHAHWDECPFADDEPDEQEQHRNTSCGSWLCCVTYG